MAERIRVLHVDDEPQFTEMAATFLERENDAITVDRATEPEAALDRLSDEHVDCVVSDYDMPGMDGLELLERVREVDATVPFILFTGKGSEEVASEALSKGATDYLRKATGRERYALLANRIENAVVQTRSVVELERQREILDEAQEMAALGVCELDLETGEAWLSEGIYRIFDVPRPAGSDAHLDAGVEDVLSNVHPDDRESVHEAAQASIDDGLFRELEVRAADGRRWLALRMKPRAEAGPVGRLRVTVQDVTDQKHREQALRRQEHRFEAVFEDPEMLVGVLDPDGRVREVNETATSYVDADLADLVGDPFEETPWWGDEDRDRVRAWLDEAATGEYVTYEADVSRQSAPSYSVIGSIRPVTDAAGAVEALVVSARDVTERKRRERELENYETIIEGLGESTFKTNADGEQVAVNTAGAQITGYDEDELLGSTGETLYGAEEFDRIEAATVDLATDPDRDLFTMESHIQTRDGEEVPVELTVTDRWGIDGEFLGTVGVVTDVSEQRAVERELQEYKSIIRAIPDEVSILDTDGHITRIIPPTGSETTVSGYDPADLEGEHIGTVMTDDDMETGVELIEELVTTDRQRGAFEMEVVTQSGERHWRENHLALLAADDGSIQGTVGVLRDIEERKAYERELERQNERLEEFAEIASHDLRNPLNLAQGYLDLLAEDCDTAHVADMGSALDRMERLIEDTLVMARQGANVSERTEVDLGGLVPDCLAAVGGEEATVTVAEDLRIVGDESRARQLLENLLRNAVEHGSTSPPSQAREDAGENDSPSPPSQAREDAGRASASEPSVADAPEDAVEHGGEDVCVEIGAIDGDGETDTGFYVADDGPGVPPEERDEILEAGYTTSAEGTGFGLAIVAEVVDAHGWEIAITESEAGGARFEITGVELAD